MFNYKAKFEEKIWDVVAMDWNSNNVLISCHLLLNGEVKKVYPEKNYGDDVTLLKMSTRVDNQHNQLYEGVSLLIDNSKKGTLLYDSKLETFIIQIKDTQELLSKFSNEQLRVKG